MTVLQRTHGEGRIGVVSREGHTRLADLYQEGAAKIRLPRQPHCEAVLVNTAGGLTDGDRLSWSATAQAKADLTLTTQACERAYRARHGSPAQLHVALEAQVGARLAWLPQETILYDACALHRRLDVVLAPATTFLACEAILLGRRAMGERLTRLDFRDDWRVRMGGRLVHAEALALDDAEALARPAMLDGATAMASILMIGATLEVLLAPARELVGERGAVSILEVAGTPKMVVRLVAPDGRTLRRHLVPLLALLHGRALPKAWSS